MLVFPLIGAIVDTDRKGPSAHELVNRLGLAGERYVSLRTRMEGYLQEMWAKYGEDKAVFARRWWDLCMYLNEMSDEYRRERPRVPRLRAEEGGLELARGQLPSEGIKVPRVELLHWWFVQMMEPTTDEAQVDAGIILLNEWSADLDNAANILRDFLDKMKPDLTSRQMYPSNMRRVWKLYKTGSDVEVTYSSVVPGAIVVLRFGNGMTVQRLVTKAQFGHEGNSMNHCIGGGGHDDCLADGESDYYKLSRDGKVVIWSIRDAEGRPQASVCWVIGSLTEKEAIRIQFDPFDAETFVEFHGRDDIGEGDVPKALLAATTIALILADADYVPNKIVDRLNDFAAPMVLLRESDVAYRPKPGKVWSSDVNGAVLNEIVPDEMIRSLKLYMDPLHPHADASGIRHGLYFISSSSPELDDLSYAPRSHSVWMYEHPTTVGITMVIYVIKAEPVLVEAFMTLLVQRLGEGAFAQKSGKVGVVAVKFNWKTTADLYKRFLSLPWFYPLDLSQVKEQVAKIIAIHSGLGDIEVYPGTRLAGDMEAMALHTQALLKALRLEVYQNRLVAAKPSLGEDTP